MRARGGAAGALWPFLGCVLALSGCSAPAGDEALALVDWRYAFASDGGGEEAPDAPPGQAWRPVGALARQGLERRAGGWLATDLPWTLPAEPLLVFRSYTSRFVLYVGGEPIYRYSADESEGLPRDRLSLHVVGLPEGAAGYELSVWVFRSRLSSALSERWLVVGRAGLGDALTAYVREPIREGAASVALGSVLAVVGLLAVVLGLRRPLRPDWLALSFGGFAALYGLRVAASSHLLLLLGTPIVWTLYAVSIITYLIHVPAWGFFRSLLGGGRLLGWLLRVSVLFAAMGVAADLVTGTPFAATGLPNNLFVLFGLGVVFWEGARRYAELERDLRPLLLGLTALGLAALHDNLRGLGIVPLGVEIEPAGFVVFVGVLGLVTARRVLRGAARLAGLEGELEAARRIQGSLLPQRLPRLEGATLAARFVPASTVAGDLYDVLPSDSKRAGVLVADVAGHGVPAALVASMVKVALSSARSLASRPARLLEEMNRILCANLEIGFVTAVYAWVDLEVGRVRLASAGHPRPLLRRRDGTVTEIAAAGTILGRFADARFEEAEVALGPGERMLFFTDGIVEARGAGDEHFGEQRLARLFREQDQRPDDDGEELLGRVLDSVARWEGGSGARPEDDRTLLLLSVIG